MPRSSRASTSSVRGNGCSDCSSSVTICRTGGGGSPAAVLAAAGARRVEGALSWRKREGEENGSALLTPAGGSKDKERWKYR